MDSIAPVEMNVRARVGGMLARADDPALGWQQVLVDLAGRWHGSITAHWLLTMDSEQIYVMKREG